MAKKVIDPKTTPYFSMPLTDITRELWTTRRDLATLKSRDDQIIATFKFFADPMFDKNRGQPLIIGDFYVVTRVPGSSSRVDPQKLLARGVSPDVIAECTDFSSYFQYKIKCKDAEVE